MINAIQVWNQGNEKINIFDVLSYPQPTNMDVFLFHFQTKMHEYWPEEEVRKTGPLLIEKLQDHKQPDFIIRDFKVTNSQVTSLSHYTRRGDLAGGKGLPGWADKRIPLCFSSFKNSFSRVEYLLSH